MVLKALKQRHKERWEFPCKCVFIFTEVNKSVFL